MGEFTVISEKTIKIIRIKYSTKPFSQYGNVEKHLRAKYGEGNVKIITRFENGNEGSKAILKARINVD